MFLKSNSMFSLRFLREHRKELSPAGLAQSERSLGTGLVWAF